MTNIPPHNEGPRFDHAGWPSGTQQNAGGWLSGSMEPEPAEIPRSELSSPPATVLGSSDSVKRIKEIHGCPSNDGNCLECGRPHPCVTYQLAIRSMANTPPAGPDLSTRQRALYWLTLAEAQNIDDRLMLVSVLVRQIRGTALDVIAVREALLRR